MNKRPTKATYRRRQILALAVLVVLIVIIWNLVAGIAGFISGVVHPAAKPTSTSAATANASPGVISACAPAAVTVQAKVSLGSTEASVFSAKQDPSLSFTITNVGTQDCTFDVGSKVQFFTITSGKEVIWDSKDCLVGGKPRAASDTDSIITLSAGQPMTSPASIWQRVYSSSTGCSATTEKPVAGGGASYHLAATINGVKSSNDVQFILK